MDLSTTPVRLAIHTQPEVAPWEGEAGLPGDTGWWKFGDPEPRSTAGREAQRLALHIGPRPWLRAVRYYEAIGDSSYTVWVSRPDDEVRRSVPDRFGDWGVVLMQEPGGETGDSDSAPSDGSPSDGAPSEAVSITMLEQATAYEAPDANAAPMGTLAAGDPVVRLQGAEGWSLVSFGDTEAPSFGWVPSYAVAEIEEPADAAVQVEDFEAPLARFGTWIDDPQHGRIWQPAPDVAGADFAPYVSDGTWVVTDDGQWVFRSRWDDGFGWATYHYGRWVDHDRFGWVWVPGTHWAPAWVDWRHGGGHVGWVPLGPPGVAIPEHRWTFVEERRFGDPGGVRRWRVPAGRLHEVFVGASPLPRRPGLAWARGPAVGTIRAAGSPVEVVRVSVPTSHAVRAQAAAALAHAAEIGRPVVRPGGVTAVVRHGPNAGAAVPVVARPPAPPAVAIHGPGASPRPQEHPVWTVPHPLLAPHGTHTTGPTPGVLNGTTPPPPQSSAGRSSPARPGPAPVNQQQSPSRARGKETGEAAGPYDGSRFVGGTLIAVWSPGDQRWIDVARTPPGRHGAHAGEEIGRAVAHTLSEAIPGVVFVQLIARDPAYPGVRSLVAREGSIVSDQRAHGAVAPPWPAWTRASGIAPLPRANPFGLDGTTFAESARVALWLKSAWDDFAEVLPFTGIDLPARCGARVASEFAKATGRTGRTKVVRRAGETGVTLFACDSGSACTSESFALGAAPAWTGEAAGPVAPDSTPNDNASPTTIGNPAAFAGGSVVSLWVPPSGKDPGRWEDVARTPPGERGRRLADELGVFLVDILGGVAPGSAFGVVVHRSPEAARGMLLVARPDGGRAHGVGFPAGKAPRWPAWVKLAEQPFARSAGYAGDADSFDRGSLVSQYDRSGTRWDDLVESRGATAYDFGGTIARYLAQTTADRGELVGLTRYVQRDPRAWTGTVYVASEPGGHPREELFPAGTAPTWARLLSGAPEAGEVGGVGNVLANVLTGGLFGAAQMASRGPDIAREAALRVGPEPRRDWAHWGGERRWRDRRSREREAFERFRRGFRRRGEASGPGSEAGAPPMSDPIGVAPLTALEQLLLQIDHRFPYRGKGPLDGIRDNVLRITEDPGRLGKLRTGPDLHTLEAVVRADPRTHATRTFPNGDARYLAIVVKPLRLSETGAWDLSDLSGGGNEAGAPPAGVETGPWAAAFQLLHEINDLWPWRSRAHDGVTQGNDRVLGQVVFLDITSDGNPAIPVAAIQALLVALDKDPRFLGYYPAIDRRPYRLVMARDRASDGSPWDLSGAAGAEAARDAAGPEGDGSEALAALLRQINALYPNRSTARQDGIQVERGRKALALTDDTDPHVGARMPSFAALVAALQRDARFDRAETLEPGFWNSIERPYLRILTREGPASDDGRPWDLSGLRGAA